MKHLTLLYLVGTCLADPTLISVPSSEISASGHGPGAVPIELDAGLAIFNWTHDGTSWLDAVLLDANGIDNQDLVFVLGPYNGSSAAWIPKDGAYVANIDANGNWTMSISQLKNAA